jgi:hypothetical protein
LPIAAIVVLQRCISPFAIFLLAAGLESISVDGNVLAGLCVRAVRNVIVAVSAVSVLIVVPIVVIAPAVLVGITVAVTISIVIAPIVSLAAISLVPIAVVRVLSVAVSTLGALQASVQVLNFSVAALKV